MEVKTIVEQLTNEKSNSHAFLVETHTQEDNEEVLKSVKIIACPNKHVETEECFICNRIEKNEFLETIFLDTDKETVKKEDIINIQKRFSNHMLEAKKMVYVISNVHNLSVSVSNSLLKFLEEPPVNVIAIFTTNNTHKVLDTIKSRCQIIRKAKKEEENLSSIFLDYYNYSQEDIDLILKVGNEFIEKYEEEKEKTIVYLKKLVHDKLKNKKDYINFINVLILLYKDIIDYKIKKVSKYDFINHTKFINVNFNIINDRINYLVNNKSKLEQNANQKLFLDKICIEMGELNEEIYRS